jgi:hypothetical protein
MTLHADMPLPVYCHCIHVLALMQQELFSLPLRSIALVSIEV